VASEAAVFVSRCSSSAPTRNGDSNG
jgi:hypothetical protein